ncbi:MAG: ABC transporter ATP-binding protein, partial [Oscillospiraceae bacterium]|nr:ABC transporter ATP-binding protein [Oscillospiraceae bacterium]
DVADKNATAIITSHSLRELEDTCDQLALLHKGGLILQSDVQDLKTSLFKVQIAFDRPFDEDLFSSMQVESCLISGGVAQLILRGDKNMILARLKQLDPILLDVLPLNLEEIFTYEMKELGYSFEDVLEKEAES